MRKRFVAPVLRAEATLAHLTLCPATSGNFDSCAFDGQ
jgi:hypothetical protein